MMLVNRDGPIADDPWRFIADGEETPGAGDIVVSCKRFIEERGVLGARGGRLGVRIAPADKVEALADFLGALALVEIEFPAFRDGRGFSTARLLRDRFQYQGEVRAIGDVLEDQVFYMLRSGISSFALKSADPAAAIARAAKTFAISYQSASDRRAPIHLLRAERTAARTAGE